MIPAAITRDHALAALKDFRTGTVEYGLAPIRLVDGQVARRSLEGETWH